MGKRPFLYFYYFIETMPVFRTVSEIFSVKETRDLETGVGSFKVIQNGAVP